MLYVHKLALLALFLACFVIVEANPDENRCLSANQVKDGAKVVKVGSNKLLEYHTFGVSANEDGAIRLLLQHGTAREGGVFAYFDSFFLAHKLSVIAPTLPGHGCSSRDPDRAISSWGESIHSVLKKENWLDDKGFLVAGFSFGGSHVLGLLASPQLEDHINGVFMVSPTLPSDLKGKIEGNAPEEIVPMKSLVLHKSIGPTLVSLLHKVARKRTMGRLYKAMDEMRVDGLSALAAWLEESTERALRGTGSKGLADNLRLRHSNWGTILPNAASALARKPKEFPFLILTEKNDTIDPSAVSLAISSYLNEQSPANGGKANFQEWPTVSKHGHWHYWVRFEDEIRHFLDFANIQTPLFDSESARSCHASPPREYGPFFKLNQPYKNQICEEDEFVQLYGWAAADSTFGRSYTPGSHQLEVSGSVNVWNGTSCIPVANAEIDVWQSHQYGPYGNLKEGVQDGFCRGVVRTDDRGRFHFSTYMPASYGALAGVGPFGPSFDVPPFVDRHIHLAVWAENRELLVTQILYLDDPLLKSSVRSAPHGYEGTGVLLKPQKDGVWKFEGVTLTLPRVSRPSRLHSSRKRAAKDFCNYSHGDMLVPAVCMPSLERFMNPMTIYFVLMPCTLYLWAPLLVFLSVRFLWKTCFCGKLQRISHETHKNTKID